MWILFALLTPFLFSITNFIEKYAIEKKVKDPVIFPVLGSFIALIAGILIFAFRGIILLPPIQTLALLVSGVFLIFYLIPYFKALAIDDPSRVVPLFQIVPVFVLIMSHFFLGETLTRQQSIGFIVIMSGSFLLSAEKTTKGFWKPRPAFWWMMLSSFLYSLTAIFFKFAVINVDFWTSTEYQAIGSFLASIAILLIPVYRRRFAKEAKKATKTIWAIVTTNQVLGILADISINVAILLAPVAFVEIVGGIQPVFVLIIGVVLSLWFPHVVKEDIRRETLRIKIASIIMILIGVFLIYK